MIPSYLLYWHISYILLHEGQKLETFCKEVDNRYLGFAGCRMYVTAVYLCCFRRMCVVWLFTKTSSGQDFAFT